jgi:hypothetical protein
MSLPPRIVGGMFGFPDAGPFGRPRPAFLAAPHLALVNGRSAIALVVDGVGASRVWIPSYICAAVVEAARPRADVRFYPIDEHLCSAEREWISDVRRGDVVIVVDYFGFPFDGAIASELRSRGGTVLRDACQALLTDAKENEADFTVFSPRKFVGVPDGGILRCAGPLGDDRPLDEAPAIWSLDALRAVIWRGNYDSGEDGCDWFGLFQRVESEAPIGRFAMSAVSHALLARAFDWNDIAARRCANYRLLADRFPMHALFPHLRGGVVPLGFPMRVRNRDGLRRSLFANRIYPPVHWPIPLDVPAAFTASHRLSGDILTIPCDQRYGAADMERVADLIDAHLER